MGTISFWSRITILVILASKKAKKTKFMIPKLVPPTTKMLRNPFFHHFEPQKGYGRVCHRYIGKVTKFGLFRIIIFRSNCHFLVGGRKTPPPYRSRVKPQLDIQTPDLIKKDSLQVWTGCTTMKFSLIILTRTLGIIFDPCGEK